jgi:hypothetical protein
VPANGILLNLSHSLLSYFLLLCFPTSPFLEVPPIAITIAAQEKSGCYHEVNNNARSGNLNNSGASAKVRLQEYLGTIMPLCILFMDTAEKRLSIQLYYKCEIVN